MNLTEPPQRRPLAASPPTPSIEVRSVISLPADAPQEREFWDVLSTRRTRYASRPLSLERLGTLLGHTCRVNSRDAPRRPWPSAGALYPIEVVVEGLDGAANALFRYCADTHALHELAVDSSTGSRLRSLAEECLPSQPATLIWLAACEERTASRYINGESLIWRDAGGLLATIALAAQALGLAAAQLGITGQPVIAQLPWSHAMFGVGAMNLSQP